MSQDGKAPSPKDKQPQANVAELPGPIVQYVGVDPSLMREAIDLLSMELPMVKARRVVEALEKCQVFAVPKK